MASAALLGTNAGFKYTPPAMAEQTFQLALPIFIEGGGKRQWRVAVDSMDGSNREITTSGDALDTLRFTIRLDDQPEVLLDVLNYAANGTELRYFPDLGVGTNYPMTMVSPSGNQIDVRPDRDRGVSHGEYEVSLVVRAPTTGTTYDALL